MQAFAKWEPSQLLGLAGGGVCPASAVTGTAVRSYRTISPLPPAPILTINTYYSLYVPLSNGTHTSCRTLSVKIGVGSAVYFLWHFPCPRFCLRQKTRGRWLLAITVPYPARTFLPAPTLKTRHRTNLMTCSLFLTAETVRP